MLVAYPHLGIPPIAFIVRSGEGTCCAEGHDVLNGQEG